MNKSPKVLKFESDVSRGVKRLKAQIVNFYIQQTLMIVSIATNGYFAYYAESIDNLFLMGMCIFYIIVALYIVLTAKHPHHIL